MSNSNLRRASRISRLFDEDDYYRHTKAVATIQALSELLTDCMHYAEMRKLDFEHVAACARIRYEMEKRGTYDKHEDRLDLREGQDNAYSSGD